MLKNISVRIIASDLILNAFVLKYFTFDANVQDSGLQLHNRKTRLTEAARDSGSFAKLML